MTATAHQTLVELAEEGLGYREYADGADRIADRQIVATARAMADANAAKLYWASSAADTTEPPAISTAEDVRAANGEWRVVAICRTHNAAYRSRSQWIANGFAATSKSTPNGYLVHARSL
jgi:hypothetical protein